MKKKESQFMKKSFSRYMFYSGLIVIIISITPVNSFANNPTSSQARKKPSLTEQSIAKIESLSERIKQRVTTTQKYISQNKKALWTTSLLLSLAILEYSDSIFPLVSTEEKTSTSNLETGFLLGKEIADVNTNFVNYNEDFKPASALLREIILSKILPPQINLPKKKELIEASILNKNEKRKKNSSKKRKVKKQ